MPTFADAAMEFGIPFARLARLLELDVSTLYRWDRKSPRVSQHYRNAEAKLDILRKANWMFVALPDHKVIKYIETKFEERLGYIDQEMEEKERKIIQIRESRKLIAEEAKRLRGIISNRKDVIRQAKEFLARPLVVGNRDDHERKRSEVASKLHLCSTELAAAETELATLLATGQLPPEPAPPLAPVYSPEYSIDVEPTPDPSPEPRKPRTDPRQPPLRLTPDDAWTPHSYTPEQLDYLNSRYDPYIDYDGEQYYREAPGGPDQPPGPWQAGGFYTRKGYPLPEQFWADVF